MENTSVNTKKKKRLGEMDLTTGNFFWKVPLFALPMALTTLLQLLYTTVDLTTVAQYGGGSLSMSAVGSNTPLINLILSLFVAMAVGVNVAVGNAKGANDKERASKALHSSIIFALLCGITVGILGYFIAPYLLRLMNTPESIFSKATQYLQIYFVGMPFLMIYNFGSQALRALGDSQRPLYILILSGIFNIIFDPILVIYGHMDVAGVAWATVISEAISALLTLLWLFLHKKGYVYLEWKKLRMDKESIKEIVKIGLPAGIQALGFNIPNVLIQSSLYTIDNYTINGVLISQDEIIAGSSASSNIEGYVYAFIDAFAMTAVSFVGQNYGAKKEENIKKVFWDCQIWMMICCLICSLICGFFDEEVLSIFITDGQGIVRANALEAGKQRMYMMIFTYVLDGFMDIFGCYLRGMKHSTTPAMITLIGVTGSRILFLYALFPLPQFHTIFWLYFTYPLSWAIVDIIYIPVTLYIQKKVFRSFHTEETKAPAVADSNELAASSASKLPIKKYSNKK